MWIDSFTKDLVESMEARRKKLLENGDFFWSTFEYELPNRLSRVVSSLKNNIRYERGENNYELTVELPGCKKENVSIEIDRDTHIMTLEYKKNNVKEAEKVDVILPQDIKYDTATSKLEDGILYVTFEYDKPEPKINKVSINVS